MMFKDFKLEKFKVVKVLMGRESICIPNTKSTTQPKYQNLSSFNSQPLTGKST